MPNTKNQFQSWHLLLAATREGEKTFGAKNGILGARQPLPQAVQSSASPQGQVTCCQQHSPRLCQLRQGFCSLEEHPEVSSGIFLPGPVPEDGEGSGTPLSRGLGAQTILLSKARRPGPLQHLLC